MGRTDGISALRALVILTTLALGGCFQGATAPEPPAVAVSGAPDEGAVPDPLRSRIVFTALQMIGVPYRYGGATPQGFDCSGLVQYAYRSAGVAVPRTSREQFRASAPVQLAEAGPGDLLFFRSKDYSHVGIYLGEGRFVHAPSTGRTVEISNVSELWFQRNFVRAGTWPALERGAVSAAAACEVPTAGAC